MTSTELKIGLTSSTRPSSRVLKPPGGGHSNIFAEADVKPNAPRPRYNQQNSSNLNVVMNTVDPNEAVEKTREEIQKAQVSAANDAKQEASSGGSQKSTTPTESTNGQNGRGRVPPGGYSSGGFW